MKIFILISLLISASVKADVIIKLDSKDLVYPDCHLIWNAQQGSTGNQVSFIELGCENAPIGGPLTYVGGNTTLTINARNYICPLTNFVAVTVPDNDVVVRMDCRVLSSNGFEKP